MAMVALCFPIGLKGMPCKLEYQFQEEGSEILIRIGYYRSAEGHERLEMQSNCTWPSSNHTVNFFDPATRTTSRCDLISKTFYREPAAEGWGFEVLECDSKAVESRIFNGSDSPPDQEMFLLPEGLNEVPAPVYPADCQLTCPSTNHPAFYLGRKGKSCKIEYQYKDEQGVTGSVAFYRDSEGRERMERRVFPPLSPEHNASISDPVLSKKYHLDLIAKTYRKATWHGWVFPEPEAGYSAIADQFNNGNGISPDPALFRLPEGFTETLSLREFESGTT